MNDEEYKKALDYFDKVCDLNGAAVSSVEGGHIIKFKIAFLKQLLEQYGSKEELIIFIQTPQYDN